MDVGLYVFQLKATRCLLIERPMNDVGSGLIKKFDKTLGLTKRRMTSAKTTETHFCVHFYCYST